jgi:hypothetical protein
MTPITSPNYPHCDLEVVHKVRMWEILEKDLLAHQETQLVYLVAVTREPAKA